MIEGSKLDQKKSLKGKAKESFGSVSGFVGSMAMEVWKTQFSLPERLRH